jgi:hypothetical protein
VHSTTTSSPSVSAEVVRKVSVSPVTAFSSVSPVRIIGVGLLAGREVGARMLATAGGEGIARHDDLRSSSRTT